MKILLFAGAFYPSQKGGPSNAIYWLASGLAHAGYEVKVVASNEQLENVNLQFDQWLDLNGFKVVYAQKENRELFFDQALTESDVLMASGVCSVKSYFRKRKALKLGKKVVLSPRGELLDPAVFHKGKMYGMLKKTIFYSMRILFAKKTVFHATSDEEYNAIRKYMGKRAKIVVIPNYMILPDRVDDASVSKERKKLVYVGRLNPIKNLELLIRCVAKSSSFNKGNYELHIAGTGNPDYCNALVQLTKELGVKDKVVFLGQVEGKEKDTLYANAKCSFLVSKSENFGNVVIEALCQGTPVITSKGTPWKELKDFNAGDWVEANEEEITAAIDKILSLDSVAYDEMRKNCLRLADSYNIYTHMEQWEELLKDMMAS